MIIQVINFGVGITDVEVIDNIEAFKGYLQMRGIDCSKIEFRYNEVIVRELIMNCIEEYVKSGKETSFIASPEYMFGMNDYLYKSGDKVVILGVDDSIGFDKAWGESDGTTSIVKELNRSVIWHEVAHLLGCDDHYDENNGCGIKDECKGMDCIMRWGDVSEKMCDSSIKEINLFLMKLEQ